MSDEFYIGYEPEAPAGLARRLRFAAGGLLAFTVVAAAVFAVAHRPSSDGTFEYGIERQFEGTVGWEPYPVLMAEAPEGGARRYWLVSTGKHGASTIVQHLRGSVVRLRGSLIHRAGEFMIQVDPASVEVVSRGGATEVPRRAIGGYQNEGEIVDSKCHLGVMKPAEGPTHRDCAVRCLLGGIPPMFVPADPTPSNPRRLLVTAAGAAFPPSDLAGVVGRLVRVRGTRLASSAHEVLAADRGAIELRGGY